MKELPINVRIQPAGDVRPAAWKARDGRRDDRRVGDRFVAVRPATAPLPEIANRTVPGASERPAAVARPALPSTKVILPSGDAQLPPGDRAALLIGAAVHDHDAYAELPAVSAGLRDLKNVLERADVGMMDTCVTLDGATRAELMRGLEAFCEQREHGDTVLVYLTGHVSVSDHDGRPYFVTRDTDPDDLERTAVAADFVRRQLEECRATSKIVLLDCCDVAVASSGGPSAPPAGAAPAWPGLLEPAGVYVISASARPQPESELVSPAGAAGMSRFTCEVVEGLRSGRVKSGLGHWVTAQDLSAYLAERMGQLDVPVDQRPVTSTLAVSGSHVIARSAVRALSLLSDKGGTATRPASVVGRPRYDVGDLGDGGDPGDPRWRDLISYYRACLTEAASPEALPPRENQAVDYFPIEAGAEVLLSGKTTTAAAPDGVDTFDWKDREVWYGYPLVTLASGGRRHSDSPLASPRVAPLLVQRAEVTVDGRGAAALRPTGPVMPHAGVVRACLDERDAASVLASWRQTWQAGDDRQLLSAARRLMKRLGLAESAPLDPSALSAADLGASMRTGVHNTACVLYVESARQAALTMSAELAAIADDASWIPGTAARVLAGPVGEAATRTDALLVTPDEAGDSHQAAVESAMSRPLTVVTAPPGTGKDSLLVNVVATAVAAGERVLVASSNDEALDSLAERCAKLAPGLLVKTGDARARAEEKQLLRQLLRDSAEAPPRRTAAVVAEDLSAARAALANWSDELAARVGLEARLRRTCSARAAAADRLGLPAQLLGSAWLDDDESLASWIDRARELDAARMLTSVRRRHAAVAYVRALSVDDEAGSHETGQLRRRLAEPAAFDALVLFARAEQRFRKDRREVDRLSDDQLDAQGRMLAEDVRQLSAELVEATVAEQVAAARPQIEARRLALEPGGRSRQTSQRELMRDLGGWAVTLDAAQQLALSPAMFDLVVIDDAHECPTAAALPLLFRARRAMVIGDPMRRRLPDTLTCQRSRRAREQASLSASWLEERHLTFQADSLYDVAARNAGQTTLLDEHDQCHPGIARIVDDSFYGSRLTVLTDVTELRRARDPESGHSTLLLWEDVRGKPEPGPNGGSWRNQAEIDRVVWAVKELRDQLPKGSTVGVVTPFRAQADELRWLFRFEPVVVASAADPALAPCDAVVLSLVAGDATAEQNLRWIETNGLLWTTALTAARSQVVTVGCHAFWAGRAGVPALLAKLSSVRSFHVRPVPPAPPTSSAGPDPLADLLEERLAAAGHETIERDAWLDGYRCDALVATADGGTAILLDRGQPADRDAAGHLRMLLRRRRVLAGIQPDSPLPITRVNEVVRVPAWQVRSGAPIPGLTDS